MSNRNSPDSGSEIKIGTDYATYWVGEAKYVTKLAAATAVLTAGLGYMIEMQFTPYLFLVLAVVAVVWTKAAVVSYRVRHNYFANNSYEARAYAAFLLSRETKHRK